jgi:prephenate dehydrogenase
VIGLGQTGGSVALRLTRDKAAHVTGYDLRASVLRRARSMKLVDTVTSSLTKALRGADIVILAIPVADILGALSDAEIPFDPDSLIMDVGSTKRLIMKAANQRQPQIRFVGGHPLAGNERRGLDAVEYGMFDGKPFPLIKGRHASQANYKTATRLVGALGARPFAIDADEHDRITGLTIGLPHTIAFLVRSLYERELLKKGSKIEELSGGSIWSTMRVSKSDPVMVVDFIQSNRDWVEHWWHEMAEAKGPSRKKKKR